MNMQVQLKQPELSINEGKFPESSVLSKNYQIRQSNRKSFRMTIIYQKTLNCSTSHFPYQSKGQCLIPNLYFIAFTDEHLIEYFLRMSYHIKISGTFPSHFKCPKKPITQSYIILWVLQRLNQTYLFFLGFIDLHFIRNLQQFLVTNPS